MKLKVKVVMNVETEVDITEDEAIDIIAGTKTLNDLFVGDIYFGRQEESPDGLIGACYDKEDLGGNFDVQALPKVKIDPNECHVKLPKVDA